GIQNITGDLTLDSTSTFKEEIGGASPGNGDGHYDQVNVTGSADLGDATLNASLFGTFNPETGVPTGTSFTILTATNGISGVFAAPPANGDHLTIGTGTFAINYGPNAVTLTTINDTPTITAGDTLSYTENQPAPAI